MPPPVNLVRGAVKVALLTAVAMVCAALLSRLWT
jgi:hypothetical protein